MKTLAVIGANEPLIPFFKQLVGKYRLIAFAWEKGAVCKVYCDKFYPISFVEKERILEICKEEAIDGITSFSLESALPTVIYVAQHMNLTSNTEECLRLTATKYSQRECFKKNSIPTPNFWLINSENKTEPIDCKYPIVVKPIDSGGSQGINIAYSSLELKSAIENSLSFSKSGQVIIEDYIDGREFSVEYISYKGKHYFLQLTDKVTTGAPHFVEMQHHQPADVSLGILERIKTMVEQALTALHIENSASHTEIKLNSNRGLYIIEIGARMGGGHITSDLVKLSTGYDFVEGVAKLACGDFTIPMKTKNNCSGIYFYNKLQSYVRNYIINSEKYSEIVDTLFIDDDLQEVKSNFERNGYIIYCSTNKFML